MSLRRILVKRQLVIVGGLTLLGLFAFTFIVPIQEYPTTASQMISQRGGCTDELILANFPPFTQSDFHLLFGEYNTYRTAMRNYDAYAHYFSCEGLKIKLYL